MTDSIRPRTLLDRIGGPQSLSWPVVIAAYVFTWLAFVFDLPSPGMPEQAVRVGSPDDRPAPDDPGAAGSPHDRPAGHGRPTSSLG